MVWRVYWLWDALLSPASYLRLSDRPWSDIEANCPDCRWITLKPFGPDHPEYRHVLIKPTGTGFRVVWAGDAGLLHLRVSADGGGGKRARRAVSADAQQAHRERALERWERVKRDLHVAASSVLGYDSPDAPELAELVPVLARSIERRGSKAGSGDGQRRQRRGSDEPPSAETRLARSERLRTPADRAALRAADEWGLGLGIDLSRDRVLPREVRERIDGLDADALSDLVLIAESYRRERRRANAALREEATETVADTVVRGEALQEMGQRVLEELRDAYQRSRELQEAALRNIRMWDIFDMAGRGVYRHYAHGATEAAHAVGVLSMQRAFPSGLVHLLGVEGSAQLMAMALADSMDADSLQEFMGQLESHHREVAVRQPQDLLERALVEAEQTRMMIHELRDSGHLSGAVAARELARNTIHRQALIGRTAGSLAFSAALLDALRRRTYESDIAIVGDATVERVTQYARRLGLREGDFTVRRESNGRTRLVIRREKARAWYQHLQRMGEREAALQRIREHQLSLGEDWRPQGMDDSVRLTEEQRAAIEFALQGKRVVWDLKAGIGKSLASLALGKHLLDTGQVKQVFLFVPSNLRDTMLAEIRKFFGRNVRVAVAGELSPESARQADEQAVGVQGRGDLIRNTDADFVIVGHATLHADQEAIREKIRGLGGQVLMVLDEAHQAFSPGTGQSQIMQAMYAIRGAATDETYQVAMTGTPIRTSTGDIARIARWVAPDGVPSDAQMTSMFDGLGTGANAYHALMEQALQHTLANTLLTEEYSLDVPFAQHTLDVDLDAAQLQGYHGAEEEDPTERMYARYKAVYDGAPESSALVARLKQVVAEQESREDLRAAGRAARGIVHVNYFPAVETIQKAFKSGEVLAYTSEQDARTRAAIRNAFNHGHLVPGVRVVWDGGEGVVESVYKDTYRVRTDDGQRVTVRASDNPRSGLKLIVATGAGSTGLNLQGGSYTVDWDLPLTEAQGRQRHARVYRRGQTHRVDIYRFNPRVPEVARHAQKLVAQGRLQDALSSELGDVSASVLDDSGQVMRHAVA